MRETNISKVPPKILRLCYSQCSLMKVANHKSVMIYESHLSNSKLKDSI